MVATIPTTATKTPIPHFITLIREVSPSALVTSALPAPPDAVPFRSHLHQTLLKREGLFLILRDLCTKAISLTCYVKNVLTRSFISINSLIPCVFALPENKIIFRAKVSLGHSCLTYSYQFRYIKRSRLDSCHFCLWCCRIRENYPKNNPQRLLTPR